MPKDIIDTIGREVKIGDIVQYSTANRSSVNINFGVVERFQSPKTISYSNNQDILKIRILRAEVRSAGYWDTPDRNYTPGAKYIKTGDFIEFNSSLLNSADNLIVIGDLKLPDNDIFNALHQKSKELLNGSSEN